MVCTVLYRSCRHRLYSDCSLPDRRHPGGKIPRLNSLTAIPKAVLFPNAMSTDDRDRTCHTGTDGLLDKSESRIDDK